MTHKMFQTPLEEVKWNFDGLYHGATDPNFVKDLGYLEKMVDAFATKHKGDLSITLGQALDDMAGLEKQIGSMFVPFFLKLSLNQKDEDAAKGRQKMQSLLAKLGQKLVFWALEIGQMPEVEYQSLIKTSKEVARHKPYLDHIRAQAHYNLSEAQEVVAAALKPFTDTPWDDYMDYLEGVLKFEFEGQPHSMKDLLDIIAEDRDPARRAAANKVFNDTLKDSGHAEARSRALNVMVNSKKAMDDLRGYTHPMQSRNLENKVADATVQALHDAVVDQAPLVQRFYKLKARLLGLEKLKWSDRNAPMPFAPEQKFTWGEGLEMAMTAIQKFSPTLAGYGETMVARGWLDVAKTENRQGGAYLYPFFVPGEDRCRCYLFQTYNGTPRDVSTLAHEMGHGVHFLASSKLGPLMYDAPMNYAETASIFAEMLLFTDMMDKLESEKDRLALLMDNMSDMMNTVARQISFSLFEQEIHARVAEEGGLSVEEYGQIWMEVTRKIYGENGDVFDYDDMDALWCYVGHFMRPFYVYAYAFGELFTRRLFMEKDKLGDNFEPLYLEMLKSGGTKDAVELMAPFGLDPNHEAFWQEAIDGSVGQMLTEAEKLADKLEL